MTLVRICALSVLLFLLLTFSARAEYFPQEYAPRLTQLPRTLPQPQSHLDMGSEKPLAALAAWRELTRGGVLMIRQARAGYFIAGDEIESRDGSFVIGELAGKRRLRVEGRSDLHFVELDGSLRPRLDYGLLKVEVSDGAFLSLVPAAWIISDAAVEYELRVDAQGKECELAVRKGLVRIKRSVGGESEVRAGRKLAWRVDSPNLRFGLIK